MFPKKPALLLLFLFLLAALQPEAAMLGVEKFPAKDVNGEGPLPYNYRIIDGHIHVGGHPLNPARALMNSDRGAKSILGYLSSKGVATIIDLENTIWVQGRYKNLLEEAGIRRIHIPMHSSKVPNEKEWAEIKQAMKSPVYIHCKWGADRAGAIIAKYLVEEKGYAGKEAWLAVRSGGTHAGALGGLKKGKGYENLALFFWPEAVRDKDYNE